MPKRNQNYLSKIAILTKVVQIQSVYSSQQSLILERTNLGLHNGKFDQYSFHFGIFCENVFGYLTTISRFFEFPAQKTVLTKINKVPNELVYDGETDTFMKKPLGSYSGP